MNWDTSCADWASRLKSGQSIIPPPIYKEQAEQALDIFKSLRVVDLPGKPTFGECSEQWVFDFVSAIFGAYDAETGNQLIREYGLLISKKNTKSTIAAGIMLTAVILCWREDEEHLILAPTKEVADNSFKPAAGMVRADEELSALFHVQDHTRTITHRTTNASLKVVAAETDTVGGKKSGKILVDELWLFGKQAKAQSMFMEATGGQVSRPEGWVIYLTTQSDEPPAGVFNEKLNYWRDVRDGKIIDKKTLGILYEYPDEMLKQKAYLSPENFYITNPNIGRSVSKEWLEDQLKRFSSAQDGSFQQFLAKHLNVEIGMNLRSDRWAGADFWEAQGDTKIDLDHLLGHCEVITVGIDGGGLDDLLGLCVIGRHKVTKKWLVWCHAWAHEIVLERRKDIVTKLLEFEKDGDLTIVKSPGDDVTAVAEILGIIKRANLLPEKESIGVDAVGIKDIVNELTTEERGFDFEQIVAIRQGFALNGAIKTTERKVAGGEIAHSGSRLMAWCVSNAKVVQQGNAILVTKQASGSAKIDPLMAVFNAVSLMGLNPQAKISVYEHRGIRMIQR